MEGRDILLLGEGNFEFAVKFCARHAGVAHRLVATDCKLRKDEEAQANMAILRKKGVLVGVLNAGSLPRGCKLSWVQFNCPCGHEATPIPGVIAKLFLWCKKALTASGSLHISLHGCQKKAQSAIDLLGCAERSGFALHDTNTTLQKRYGYEARRTNGGRFYHRGKGSVTEYVFFPEVPDECTTQKVASISDVYARPAVPQTVREQVALATLFRMVVGVRPSSPQHDSIPSEDRVYSAESPLVSSSPDTLYASNDRWAEHDAGSDTLNAWGDDKNDTVLLQTKSGEQVAQSTLLRMMANISPSCQNSDSSDRSQDLECPVSPGSYYAVDDRWAEHDAGSDTLNAWGDDKNDTVLLQTKSGEQVAQSTLLRMTANISPSCQNSDSSDRSQDLECPVSPGSYYAVDDRWAEHDAGSDTLNAWGDDKNDTVLLQTKSGEQVAQSTLLRMTANISPSCQNSDSSDRSQDLECPVSPGSYYAVDDRWAEHDAGSDTLNAWGDDKNDTVLLQTKSGEQVAQSTLLRMTANISPSCQNSDSSDRSQDLECPVSPGSYYAVDDRWAEHDAGSDTLNAWGDDKNDTVLLQTKSGEQVAQSTLLRMTANISPSCQNSDSSDRSQDLECPVSPGSYYAVDDRWAEHDAGSDTLNAWGEGKNDTVLVQTKSGEQVAQSTLLRMMANIAPSCQNSDSSDRSEDLECPVSPRLADEYYFHIYG
ncbi:hypothetical protein DIPPA_14377 [Diplonema papillatum]|nr:hypothetical protein DIPPA_14377 [Diplonema papillatum]